ncbi:MAG: hypothetical protein EA362_01140 [Saprospirales bacterium]|nr:MAG: hypothetical protein EA362_01140 [Saprospirales bacterium]
MRIFLFLCLLVLLFSCTSREEFVIELNLQKGESYWQETINSNLVTTKMPTFTNESGSEQKTRINFSVDESAEGLFHVTAFFEEVEIKLMGEAEHLEEMEELFEKTSEFQELLREINFGFTISSKGKIIEIRDFDSVVQGLDDYFKSLLPAEQLPAAKLYGFLDESFFLEAMNISMAFYPDAPKRIGDSWSKETTMEGMLNMTINSDYTLKKVDESYFYIDVAGKVDFDLEGSFFKMLNEMGNVELSGEVFGSMKVERSSGWVIDSEMTQTGDIVMLMEFPGGGEEVNEVRTLNSMKSKVKGGLVK